MSEVLSREEWLQQLKEGDQVRVATHSGYLLRNVVRVTKTQIVLQGQDRYSRTTGKNIGFNDKWRSAPRLHPVTEEFLAKLRQKENHDRLIKAVGQDLAPEVVDAMLAVYDAHTADAEGGAA